VFELELTNELVFSLFVLVALSVLLAIDKVSQENFIRIILLLIGAILGVAYGYAKASRKG
jgi:hypothetical protein